MTSMHKSGGLLRRWGTLMQRKALNVKYTVIDKEVLRAFLAGLGYDNVSLSDKEYYLTDWDTWKIIIEDDQTNTYKYLTDKTDCDNFSDYFNASVAIIYGLNTSGRFSVELLNPETGAHIGWHRASLIVATENGKLVAYAYDPMVNMKDGYCKIGEEDVVIKNWKYEFWFLSFN